MSSGTINFECSKCHHRSIIQANLVPGTPLQQGAIPYPISTDIFTCPNCNTDNNLKNLRLQIKEVWKEGSWLGMNRKSDYSIIFNEIEEQLRSFNIEEDLAETMIEVQRLRDIVQEMETKQEPLTYTRT
jgi:hypothetical protein